MGSPQDRRSPLAVVALCLPLLAPACGDDPDSDRPAASGIPADTAPADVVVEAPAAAPDAVMRAINGVHGAGPNAGGTDVLSLGFEPGVDDSVTLRWSGRRVRNGPGADFVVFENAFTVEGGRGNFMDPTLVELSIDGEAWVPLPHDYTAADETTYSDDPADWPGFAGLRPVLLNEDSNPVDPFDSAAAGGDAFNLDALPLDGADAQAVRTEGFVFLRLSAAASHVNPDTGAPYPRDPVATGPDIDGVYARHLEEQ